MQLHATIIQQEESKTIDNPLTLENLAQFEVDAPYMFEDDLPDEEEKDDGELIVQDGESNE
jgi:hypothetical protein